MAAIPDIEGVNRCRIVFIHSRLSKIFRGKFAHECSFSKNHWDGAQANGYSGGGSVSADGRYVAFQSNAVNLVPNDHNGMYDIFVHDRISKTTERVSVDNYNQEGSNDSAMPVISADDRFVAFYSYASNLVENDTNAKADVFMHNRETGRTVRASVASDGVQGNGYSQAAGISADGRFISFESVASLIRSIRFLHSWTASSQVAFEPARITVGNAKWTQILSYDFNRGQGDEASQKSLDQIPSQIYSMKVMIRST